MFASIPTSIIALGYGFLVALAFTLIKKDALSGFNAMDVHLSINIPFGLSILAILIYRKGMNYDWDFGMNAAIGGVILALAFYLQTVIVTRVPLVEFEGYARGMTALWVVVLSIVLLRDIPTVRQFIGLASVVVGVVLLTTTR